MTRKDFELIAGVIAAERDSLGVERDRKVRHGAMPLDVVPRIQTLDRITLRFANDLAETNPAFDRDRFLRAAGAA